MTTKRKNFGGRRKREPEAGERVHAGLRVTPDLKGRIERAAAKSGRSLSQEMEFRIERSLSLDAAFGSGEMHDMALKMATAFAVDADCYRSAMFSVFNALIRGAPQGDEEQTARAIEALKSSLLTKIAQQRSKDNAR